MTVLVGIVCEDGIVVGADSSATSSHGTFQTTEQPISKIKIVSGRTIVACSGPIGLFQRFMAVIEKADGERLFSNQKHPLSVAKELSRRAIEDFRQTFVGNLQTGFGFGALVAFPAGAELNLCEFDTRLFQPELKSRDGLWYVSMGSGQPICDPFLGLCRRIFWKDNNLPSLRDGSLVTAWALQHAIDVNAGGIKGPIEMAVLEKGKKSVPARKLDKSDIHEYMDNIESLEKHIGEYQSMLSGKAQEEVPKVNKM